MDSHRVRVFAHPSVRAALAAFIESRAPPSVSFDYADTGLCEHASLDAVSPGPPEAAAAEEGGSSAPPLAYFDVAEFGSALETETLGRTLLYAQTIDSTQTLLRDGLWGVDPSWGAICLAESQVKGAGRGGNTWSSPPGCLLFSFHSQFNSGRSLPFVQYMISLAVIQAIEGTTRAGGSGGGDARRLPIHIKWPNDFCARRRARRRRRRCEGRGGLEPRRRRGVAGREHQRKWKRGHGQDRRNLVQQLFHDVRRL